MTKRKTKFARDCAIGALYAIAAPAFAQATAPEPAPAPAAQLAEQTDTTVVVVTGSARPQRRFDVSYAVNSLSQNEVQKLAPLSMADLLGKLPGIQVEATGGEVQNVTRVRGIPTDDGLALFQQDGLPLFTEINGFFFRGDSLNRYDLMTKSLEVVRGGPAPIYASQAAAIINSSTVSGTPVTKGKAQVSLGTTGLKRVDAYQAGQIDDKTFYAVGGFLRQDDGHRDNGFPNDRGGQLRANLKRVLDSGTLKLSVNYLNDHNGFYLPIPISDPRNPARSLNQYIDYFDGTMNSPSLRNVPQKYQDSAGVLQTDQRDLANGRHIQFGNIGVQYEGEFGAWQVSAKGGRSKGRLNFDAFYSTSNPADATTFANGFLAASKSAFGAVDHLRYAIAGSNGAQAYNPASASGLVMQAQYRAIGSRFYSDQGDLNLTRNFQTGLGNHDVKFGAYASAYGQTSKTAFNDMLIEVQGKPRTLDLIAYSASGAILGHVTDKGVLRYSTTLNQAEADAKMGALYVNDTWEVFSGLRIDSGMRTERYRYKGKVFLTRQVNLGDPATLADNATRALGDTLAQTHSTSISNWTVGANYDFSTQFGGYARVSHLEVPPSMQVAASINPLILTTKADQYEVGFKATAGRSYLYVTGFYTAFDPLNASFTAFNPVTGRNDQTVPFFGKAVVKGAELDGALYLTDRFHINGSLTVQDPQYRDFVSATGADPSRVVGNQIIREPKVFGNIRPNYSFNAGDNLLEVYGSYSYTGKRYVDFFMATGLPAYHSIGAGVTLTRGDWKFQVVGDNLSNAKGLTEGNTRTDTLAGQGSQEAIYGRPVFGRNVRFVLSKTW